MKPIERIEQIYASLPQIECKRLCHESCGPILMSRREWERILDRAGEMRKMGDDLICPLLDPATKLCTVYELRPLICRLWGLVKKMQCHHGCVPQRWLTDEEANKMLNEVQALGGQAIGPGMDALEKLLAKEIEKRHGAAHKT